MAKWETFLFSGLVIPTGKSQKPDDSHRLKVELYANKAKHKKPWASPSLQSLSKIRSSGFSLSQPFQSKASSSLPSASPGSSHKPQPARGGAALGTFISANYYFLKHRGQGCCARLPPALGWSPSLPQHPGTKSNTAASRCQKGKMQVAQGKLCSCLCSLWISQPISPNTEMDFQCQQLSTAVDVRN